MATPAILEGRQFRAESRQHSVIPGLNALRALAILLVLAFHASAIFKFSPMLSGPLGVMIFFVLSGYLITGILLSEFRKTGDISLRRFYIRRGFRIWPAFYAAWFVTTIEMIRHGIPINWWDAAGSFFYLTDYIRAFHSAESQDFIHMGISWSLAIEEQFYILWPATLLLLLRRGANLARVLAWIIVSVWVYRAVMYLTGVASDTYLYNAFEMRADALLIGAWLVITKDSRSRLRSAVTASPWNVLPFLLWIGCMALWQQSWYSHIGKLGFLVLVSTQPIVVGIVLIQLVKWGALMWRWLDHPVIASIAAVSYALYLYHLTGADLAFRLHWFAHHHKLGFILLTTALAVGSYYLIEKPMLRVRDRACP